ALGLFVYQSAWSAQPLEMEIDAGAAEPAIVLEPEAVVARGAHRQRGRRPEIDIQRFNLKRPIPVKGPFAAAAAGAVDQQRCVGKRPADAAADRREHRNVALLSHS